MKQYEVNTFDELCNIIQSIHKKENRTLWYRGHANNSWEILPSIQRTNLLDKGHIIVLSCCYTNIYRKNRLYSL